MKRILAVLVLFLLSAGAVSAEDTPFGDLDPEMKETADALKASAMKPLKIILYTISGMGAIIGAIMIAINGYGFMKAKNPEARVKYEGNLKNIAIGMFLIVFGPAFIATFMV